MRPIANLSKAALRLTLGQRLPRYDGDLRVAGVKGDVRIRRDRWAIPHIQARTEADACFGLGFCQGQDRTFQLELFLRICRGTLAAAIGKPALTLDRLTRRIGFSRHCSEQLEACDEEVRVWLHAFADGINAGAKFGLQAPAHEFSLLQFDRTDWRADDVIAMVRFVAFIHSMSWDTQLARLRILDADGPAALAAVDPGTADIDPCSTPPGAPFGPVVDRLSAEIAAFEAWVGKGGASNNWAIGGNRTRLGRPIVANDPHLDPSVPCPFYLAHIEAPGMHAAGAAFVGAPAIAAGHNGAVAWGVTNGKADAARLYFEEVRPDGTCVREAGAWAPCRVEEEHIDVRWGKAVTERVLVTPRGPIISPAVGEEKYSLSFAATWLAPKPLRGFLTAPRADDVESFRRAFEDWPCAPLNLVFADHHGKVGWQLIGQLPAREQDYGALPGVPTVSSYVEELPFDAMPHHIGGPDDAVATANNPAHADAKAPLLGLHWTAGYRARRIFEAFDAETRWDSESCMALQMDQTSIVWREVRDVVLGVHPTDAYAREAIELLRGWNGRVTAQSAAAGVYELFLHEMGRRIVRAKAPRSVDTALGGPQHRISPFTNLAMQRFSHTSRLLREQPEGWFSAGWEREIASALSAGVTQMERKLGRDRSKWAWGEFRTLTFKHPLGMIAPLSSLFNIGPFPWGGDTTTLNMCTTHPVDPTKNPLVVATLRMVVEIGRFDDARFVLPTGQSGNPLSPHYDDMHPLWRSGDAVRMAWTPEAVEQSTVHELVLRHA